MWREVRLEDVCKSYKGRSVTLSETQGAETLPYLGAAQMSGDPASEFAYLDNAVVCDEKDVLILWDGERSGFVSTGLRGVVSSTAAKLKIADGIDPRYIYYVLDFGFDWIQGQRTGTGVPHVPKDLLKTFKFKLPDDIKIQTKIGQVLASADAAIRSTEALINKYEQIKQGMMQDLFTRGVDEHGQLRPSFADTPELYARTLMGPLPRQWAVKKLDQIVDPNRPVVYGILMPGSGYEGGIPVIKVKDIYNGSIDETSLLLTSPEIDSEYRRSKLLDGDILLTIRGSVGRIAEVPVHLAGANITQDTARISIASGHSRFYRYFLESAAAQAHFELNTLGQAVQGINLRDVRSTLCPIPDESEQRSIADRIASIDEKIARERAFLMQLHQQKLGLMQDLLTGKVRVPDERMEPKETQVVREAPPAFKRAVLAAEIVHQLHDNPRFGAVKQEKIIDLCERHLNLHDEIDRTSYRQAAGPYDNRAKRSIESNFQKQKWFSVVRRKGQGVKYLPLEKCGQHKTYFDRYFGHCAAEFQDLIDLLRDATTEQCEIVATLYAVWNDFLLEGNDPTDDEVVNEVLTNWHPEKQKIDQDRWLKAIDWMREKGLVPRGTGKHTEAVA